MANSPAQAANIKELLISSGQSNSSADVSVITPDFRYYESVLSNTTTCSMVLAESGYSMDGNDNIASEGLLDGLPIRGGERVDISIEDNYGNTLTLKDGMYVNRVRNAQPGTQNDVYMLDLCSKDYFANEQTRVVRRYEGKISDNVTKILKEVLKTDTTTFNVDSTAIDYNLSLIHI